MASATSSSPKQRAIRLISALESGGKQKMSVLALAEADDSENYKITAVILSWKDKDKGGIEKGIKLSILDTSANLKLKIGSDNSTIELWDTLDRKAPVDVYKIDEYIKPLPETSWKLDTQAFQTNNINNIFTIGARLNWELPKDGSDIPLIYIEVVTAKFLKDSLKLVLAANSTLKSSAIQFLEFSITSGKFKFDSELTLNVFRDVLPITYYNESNDNNITASLIVQFIDEKFSWRIEVNSNEELLCSVDLGSSLAKLELNLPRLTLDSSNGLLVPFASGQASAALYLDIFASTGGNENQKIINNIWSDDVILLSDAEFEKSSEFERFNLLIKIKSQTFSNVDENADDVLIKYKDGIYPSLHQNLISAFNDAEVIVNKKRKLQSFAGKVLGGLSTCQVTFLKSEEKATIEDKDKKLIVPLIVNIYATQLKEEIFKASGNFRFDLGSQDKYLKIKPGAFQADSEIIVTVEKEKVSKFSDIISLYIPQGTEFKFSPDPRNPRFEWSKEQTQEKIALRIPGSDDFSKPADKCFTFEMSEFSLNTDGFNLKGAVKSESVSLGTDSKETGFQKALAVKGVEATKEKSQQPKIGEIEFKQSKLVYGSLQAVAQLNYFDDAITTFTLAISQDEASNSLAVAGTVDITGLTEFHVDALFATFQIDLLHLGTKFIKTKDEWKWISEGAMSGRVKFQPAKGRSADEIGELAELFKGVTVDFESLNPVTMGFDELTIQFQPKQFEFAKVFKIDLRGIRIAKEAKEFGLLGDIAIERLPGVDAQLSFGGITLKEKDGKPTFTVNTIGAGFAVAGGFEISGILAWIDNEKEKGFGGSVTIKTESLPELTGLVKLTRAWTQNGELVPTLAVYFEANIEASLFAGFFLRGLGLGLGVNQALDGLHRKDLPLPQRITAFVDNPNGLPDPKLLTSWVPNPPANASDSINWMLVGKGVISYGNLPRNVAHSLVGSILLAIDQDLDIVAGVNIWLFSSIEETGTAEFISRPAARGAIAISPRSQQVYGRFRTVKNPAISKNAPELLAKVLNSVSTTLEFLCDRNGFLMEVGWPWETKIIYPGSSSILKGTLVSGFRFGIYRGLISFGLNFGINILLDAKAEIKFDTRLGSAGASLSVYGQGYFRCSFIGVIDSKFKPYLYGEVRVAATVEVKAEAYCKFSKKICGIKVRLKISFKASLKISISAALVAAMEGTNDIGFKGDAKVSISVAGYSISGNVPFQYNPDKIDKIKKDIDRMLPRFPTSKNNAVGAMGLTAFSLAALTAPPKQKWNYRVCRVRNQIRVLLFPKARGFEGVEEYPRIEKLFDISDASIKQGLDTNDVLQALREQFINFEVEISENLTVEVIPNNKWLITDNEKQTYYQIYQDIKDDKRFHVYQISNKAPRFQLGLHPQHKDKFQGFLGSNATYIIEETNSLLAWEESLEQVVITRDEVINNRDQDSNPEEARDITVGDMLSTLPQSSAESKPQEIIDPRTQNPVATNADDETAGIAPEGVYSPYFKAGDNNNDNDYDKNLANACKPEISPFQEDNSDEEINEGLSPGLLMSELVALAKDTQAQVKQPIQSYTLAPHLNLLLVFDADEELKKLFDENKDPVLSLLDLTAFKVNGEETILEPVVTGKAPEYDLIAGPYFQSKSQICLTWDFKREDEDEENSKQLVTDIRTIYEELDRFVVTRTVLQKPSQSKTLDVNPVWLRTPKGEWLRSQFQFVDDLMGDEDNSVAEGDLVQYKVVAQTLDNRQLASCIINVVRKTVKPLELVSQSLVLHQLLSAKDNTYTPGRFEFATVFTDAKEDDTEKDVEENINIIDELRLLYRFVPASTVGIYGFEQSPDVKTKWVPKQVGQEKEDESVTINFAESESENSIPWNEVQELVQNNGASTWQKLVLETPQQTDNKEVQSAYQLILDEQEVWRKIGDIPAGMAVEFYCGREQNEQVGLEKRIKARSRLFRCRHAILLPPSQLPSSQQAVEEITQDDPKVASNYFSRGNTVNAIEKLPTNPPEITYLEPQFIQGQANYETATVKLMLNWRHDSSCRGDFRACPLPGTSFNPVVSYRIHRSDAYSPVDYIRYPDESKILARPEITTRVMPKMMYQSMPSTIEVQGRAVKEGDKVNIFTDWQFQNSEVLWTTTSSTVSEPQAELTELGTVWLLPEIIKLLNEIKDNQGYSYVLKFHYPLEDKSQDAVEQEGTTPKERLEKLISTLDAKIDPFGWWALEALGLSCECHFEDSEGKPVDAERIKNILLEKLADKNYPIAILLFLAEDNETYLNVLRLIYAPSSWQLLEKTNLKNYLGLRLKGRDNEQPSNPLTDDELKLISEPLDKWLEDLKLRLLNSLNSFHVLPTLISHCITYKYNPINQDASKNLPPAQITLPINKDGLINYDLPVPDQWAHQYAVAIEVIRRYDTLWCRLQPSQPNTVQKIPYSALKHISVDRTLPLVPHNIIATPLPGGIQSLVFAHPGAFAAAASAVNATCGQYSGQTVILQRRINPQELDSIKALYTDSKVFPTINWKLYQTWLKNADIEKVKPGPQLLRGEDGKWGSVALQPVEGTQAGIYGADRYVYPDLPAYYEYRVAVYSTAGRVCSDVSTTSFISPLYDEKRQQPKTKECREVIFDSTKNTLKIAVRLIHPRFHMLEEISSLWVEAEEMLDVGEMQVRYGSLPDVFLKYQFYIQENPGEPIPVLLPLAEIIPPLTKNNISEKQPASTDTTGWNAKIQLIGAKFNNESDKELLNLPVSQAPEKPTGNLEAGELYLEFTLNLDDSRCNKILSVLQKSDARSLVYLSVTRDGVWSPIVPTTSTP